MELYTIIYLIDNFSGDPFIGWGGFVPFYIAMVIVAAMVYFMLYPSEPYESRCRDNSEAKSSWNNELGDYKDNALGWLGKLRPYLITWAIVCTLGAIGNKIVPEKDTMYKMLAAYGVTELASNDKVQQLGGKSLEVLEKAMNEYLGESEKKDK